MESTNQGEKDIATLEREADLATSRLLYACQLEAYWKYRAGQAAQEVNLTRIAYHNKKHGFTNNDVRNEPVTAWEEPKRP